jgi:hypothetical protein
VWVCVLLAHVSTASAQTTGAISGTVTDSTAGALPGATVEVTNEQTGITRTVVTDAEGRYFARELNLGEYRVTAALQGFQSSARRGVVLTIGREAIVDFQLSIGDVVETIEVTGDAPLVDTSNAGVASLVSREQMADLPLNARDFSQLISLQAGTVLSGGEYGGGGTSAAMAAGARISISGARPTANVFVLDGVEIQTAYGTLPAGVGGATLGLEAVQEFKVLASTYSAQHGRSIGGTVTAATRSGTNALRGSGYWYHRNDAFDAPNFFDFGEKPEFSRHQFGAGLGGPIMKNRTFFFVNLEHLRERLPRALSAIVPTPAAREGILPDRTLTLDPTVRPYLALYPLPNGRDFGDGTAEYNSNRNRPIDQTYSSVRIDHQIRANSSIFGRYTRDVSELLNPNDIPIADALVASRNQYFTVEQSQVLSSRLINQARFSYIRTDVATDVTYSMDIDPDLAYVDGRGLGLLQITGLSDLSGTPGNIGGDEVNSIIVANDTTYDTGRQSIHVGGAFTLFQYNRVAQSETFNAWWEYGSMTDWLTGRPPRRVRVSADDADPIREFRNRLLSLYAQDDIRLTSNVVLNLGVRYEYMTSPTETEGRLANLREIRDVTTTVGEPFYQNPGGFFSPRFGLVWDPGGDGKTSVRTGLGWFHQPLAMKDYAVTMNRQPPFWSDVDPVAADRVGLWPDLTPHLPRLREVAPQSIQVFTYNPRNPYSIQASLNVQRQLSQNLVVDIGYTGSHGENLVIRKHWDVPERVVVDGRTFFPATAPLLNPGFTRFHFYETEGTSWYHAFKATVTKRFSDGLHFQSAYTWSKAMDITSSAVAGELEGNTTVNDPWDPVFTDWGLANFHTAHVFTGSVSYRLPWGEDLAGIAGALARGWQVSGIFTAKGGTPFTAGSNTQLTRNYLRAGTPRPDLIPGGNNNPILGGYEQYFDPMQFVPQQPGYLGDLGRNTLIGPGLAKLDLSVVKEMSLGGHRNLQLRAEVFNVFNRANFGQPSSTLFNANGSRIGAAGRISRTTTTARQGQIAVRIAF